MHACIKSVAKTRVIWGGWRSSSPRPGPAVLVLSVWFPSGPSPTAHMGDSRRISTPEEGMKGSGASAQGSAWGSTFDLLPQYRFTCSDKLFWMNHLSKPLKFTPGFLLASDHLSLGLSFWETTFFLYRFTGWVGATGSGCWGWCPQTTGNFELSSVFGSNACLWNSQLKHKSFFFFLYLWMVLPPWGICPFLTLPTDGKTSGDSANKEAFQMSHTCVETQAQDAALQATACGFTPANPNLEDLIQKSDGDQTWGKFRQASLILLSQQHCESVVEVYVPPHKNKLALSK